MKDDNAMAPTDPGSTAIELPYPTNFTSPSGEGVLLASGTYEVEAVEQGLRLTPQGSGPTEGIVVAAETLTHGDALDTPRAESESSGENAHRVALFLATTAT